MQSQSGAHIVLPLHNLPPEKEKHSACEEERVKTKQDLPFQNQNEAHTGLLRRSWLPTVGGEAQDLVNQS